MGSLNETGGTRCADIAESETQASTVTWKTHRSDQPSLTPCIISISHSKKSRVFRPNAAREISLWTDKGNVIALSGRIMLEHSP